MRVRRGRPRTARAVLLVTALGLGACTGEPGTAETSAPADAVASTSGDVADVDARGIAPAAPTSSGDVDAITPSATPTTSATAAAGPSSSRLALDCGALDPVHDPVLGAAGLGARLEARDGPSGCSIVGQRGVVRVVDAGPVDPTDYLLETGFAAVDREPGDRVVTATVGGVAAAATSIGDTTVVVRIERTLEGRDAEQARAVLRLVTRHAGG